MILRLLPWRDWAKYKFYFFYTGGSAGSLELCEQASIAEPQLVQVDGGINNYFQLSIAEAVKAAMAIQFGRKELVP
jgi:hypothetical protein